MWALAGHRHAGVPSSSDGQSTTPSAQILFRISCGSTWILRHRYRCPRAWLNSRYLHAPRRCSECGQQYHSTSSTCLAPMPQRHIPGQFSALDRPRSVLLLLKSTTIGVRVYSVFNSRRLFHRPQQSHVCTGPGNAATIMTVVVTSLATVDMQRYIGHHNLSLAFEAGPPCADGMRLTQGIVAHRRVHRQFPSTRSGPRASSESHAT